MRPIRLTLAKARLVVCISYGDVDFGLGIAVVFAVIDNIINNGGLCGC
jgi:hypothetical protein